MRQIAWPNIPGKLDEAWRRFQALSWKWKAPALSLAALCALAVVLLAVALAGGGDGDAGPPPRRLRQDGGVGADPRRGEPGGHRHAGREDIQALAIWRSGHPVRRP